MAFPKDPHGRTNENLQDDIARRAERERVEPQGEVREAVTREGGAGGKSGNGQKRPHHGFEDRSGQGALGQPVYPEDILPMPGNGPTYQSGGVGTDREQLVEERKTDGVGNHTRGANRGGGADPSPGTPNDRG